MNVLTLEQAGWKKICPINEGYMENIKRILNFSGYKTVETDENLLLEPLQCETSGERTLINISGTIEENNYSNRKKIIESQVFFSNGSYEKLYRTTVRDPESYIQGFFKNEGFDSFYYLLAILQLADPTQIISILSDYVVDAFFEKYNKGKIYFIRSEDLLAYMNSTARILGTLDIFGLQEIKIDQKSEVPVALRDAHIPSFDAFINPSIKTVSNAFFPYIYTFMASRIGGYILFLLDKPIKMGPQKREFDYFTEDGIFEERRDWTKICTQDNNFDRYCRYIHKGEFNVEEMDRLIRWIVKNIDQFYFNILDFCNFCNTEEFIDFSFHRKSYLTLERIFMEICNINFELNPYVRKILYFDLHDKITNLAKSDSQDSSIIFKRLLRLSHFQNKMMKYLSSLPEPFDAYITKYTNEIFLSLIKSSVDNIWISDRRTQKGIQLREIDKENETKWIGKKFKEYNTKISEEEYSVNLLHATRNTLHGYNLRNYNFEKYMAVHRGSISDFLPDLALLWLIIILQDVKCVLSSEIAQT